MHYHELRTQRAIWEDMIDKTDRLLENVRREIDVRERDRPRSRDEESSRYGAPASVPLPERSSAKGGVGKERVWAYGTDK